MLKHRPNSIVSQRDEKGSRGSCHQRLQAILPVLEELIASSKYAERLLVGVNGRFLLLKQTDVDWFEAQGNYVRLHSGLKQHLLRRRIGNLEVILNPRIFLRVNRSAIVNIDRIREIQPLSHGDFRIVLHNGKELIMSRNYRNKFKKLVAEDSG